MRHLFLALALLALLSPARGASLADATGRTVAVPEHVSRVLPAGMPAAVLIEALAPDLLMGWPEKPSPAKAAALPPELAGLPTVPHLAHGAAQDAVAALKPDLIVDYGTVSPAYVALARTTQEQTGIPTVLLDGSLDQTAHALRALGAALHRPERGETLARLVEALLATPHGGPARRVAYIRPGEPLKLGAPDTGATEPLARLGWQVVAPAGKGWFRETTLDELARLDPDIVIFGDPAMRVTVAASQSWRGLRAVREGHAYAAPRAPFGWIEEPPSLNQALGYAWLANGPETGATTAPVLAAMFSAVVYGRLMTADELRAVADAVRPFAP